MDADTLADAVQVFMWTEEQWAAEQSGFTAQHRQEARNAMKAAWRRYYETHLKGAAAPESNEATS